MVCFFFQSNLPHLYVCKFLSNPHSVFVEVLPMDLENVVEFEPASLECLWMGWGLIVAASM